MVCTAYWFARYFRGAENLKLWEAWAPDVVESHAKGHGPDDW